jgi:hypothetical protein
VNPSISANIFTRLVRSVPGAYFASHSSAVSLRKSSLSSWCPSSFTGARWRQDVQRFYNGSWDHHVQLSFLDLGQYVAYTGREERTEPRWDTALIAGAQVGLSFWRFQNPIVLAFDARYAPGLFPHVAGRSSGAYSVGVSLGMYVPLFDFN